MGEFVKKTMMGYREVPGGHSDPECTHVILTEDEYDRLLQQISSAEQEARNTKYDADKEIGRVQIDAQRRIESAEYEAAKDIEHLEKALAAEQKESALQRGLNANLLRIARERANADRKLKPKKEHTEYVDGEGTPLQRWKWALACSGAMGNGAGDAVCRGFLRGRG